MKLTGKNRHAYLQFLRDPNDPLLSSKLSNWNKKLSIWNKKAVRIYFACTKRFSDLLKEATINVFNTRPCVRFAIFPLKNRKDRFSWSSVKGFIFLRRWKNQFKMFLEMGINWTWPNKKRVYLSAGKTSSSYDCKKRKACSHVLNIFFKNQ